MIEWTGSTRTVKRQCELLGLSRSTAYHKEGGTEVSLTEIAIKNAIDRIHFEEPSYGVRRILQRLRENGFVSLGRRIVKRYMQEMDIQAFYPGSNLSKRAKATKVYPYLLRHLDIVRPNQVWSIDITYVGTPKGFVYLTAIIDWHSRYIVGYTISNTLQTDAVIRTVKKAVERYGAPDIINSDQGSQFTSKEYIQLIQSFHPTKISMDGKGRATDNIIIERFFRSYKWERLYLMAPETIQDVKTLTHEYMRTYNERRGHQSLNYQTPSQVYFGKANRYAA